MTDEPERLTFVDRKTYIAERPKSTFRFVTRREQTRQHFAERVRLPRAENVSLRKIFRSDHLHRLDKIGELVLHLFEYEKRERGQNDE